MPTVRIRGRAWPAIVLYVLGALFAAGGVLLLAFSIAPVAALGTAAAGALCIFVAYRSRLTDVNLTVDAEGFEIARQPHVPWTNVEAIGAFQFGTLSMVGVRLLNQAAYVASLTGEQADRLRKGQLLAQGASALGLPFNVAESATSINPVAAWEAAGATQESLEDVSAEARTGQDALNWHRRRSGGWDLALNRASIDRSTSALAGLMQKYHQASSG